MTFLERVQEILDPEQIRLEEPMELHTSFRVGGPARYYLRPGISQVSELLALCRQEEMPVLVLGNGSNLLVSDQGIDGVVLELGNLAGEVHPEGNMLHAQAGATLAALAREAAKAGLTGLEFAAGIPGTVGGGIVMNAGAYGGEIKDVLAWARVLDPQGEIHQLDAGELELSYRHSLIPQIQGVVLEAAFSLEQGDPQRIRERMEELRQQRIAKQPLEYPSAGSTFKRPQGNYAGKLIMDAGLSGYRIGGAQVSEKHCGFVINRGGATAEEIYTLMDHVIRTVEDQFGVTLEPEVKLVGDFKGTYQLPGEK